MIDILVVTIIMVVMVEVITEIDEIEVEKRDQVGLKLNFHLFKNPCSLEKILKCISNRNLISRVCMRLIMITAMNIKDIRKKLFIQIIGMIPGSSKNMILARYTNSGLIWSSWVNIKVISSLKFWTIWKAPILSTVRSIWSRIPR